MRPDADGLRIAPSIPSDWNSYTVFKVFRGKKLNMTFNNPDHVQNGVKSVVLNGETLDEPYVTYCYEADQNIGEVIPGGALENPFAQSDAPAQAQAVPTVVAEGIDDMDYPLTVPEGAVFVLCDNRDNRLDSRSSRFGLVAEADIKGMARAIIWPVYRAGLLDIGPAVK